VTRAGHGGLMLGRSRSQAKAAASAVMADQIQRIRDALRCSKYSYVAGSTHGFYHYPARFSAAIARAVIETFSDRGDWVLDPFMGGGTSIVEGLALGRRMLGVDLNTLAWFVARVRTTPLSQQEAEGLLAWSSRAATRVPSQAERSAAPSIRNLPGSTMTFLRAALHEVRSLESRTQRAFARCVLLRLGQWALDCRKAVPRRSTLAKKLVSLTGEMLKGVNEFASQCRLAGLSKRDILYSRRLVCRSAVGLENDLRLEATSKRPRVVFTSPPYPGVHVVYHRWQYRGRRETPAPYWIASQRDGKFESFYTGGSRTPTGEARYFDMITAAFKSVRRVIHPDGYVVQLVGFADASRQLPRYLEAMRAAGFHEWTPLGARRSRLGRRVPNRKWYATIQGALDASSEVLLIHRPLA
jgi:DNA methylase